MQTVLIWTFGQESHGAFLGVASRGCRRGQGQEKDLLAQLWLHWRCPRHSFRIGNSGFQCRRRNGSLCPVYTNDEPQHPWKAETRRPSEIMCCLRHLNVQQAQEEKSDLVPVVWLCDGHFVLWKQMNGVGFEIKLLVIITREVLKMFSSQLIRPQCVTFHVSQNDCIF